MVLTGSAQFGVRLYQQPRPPSGGGVARTTSPLSLPLAEMKPAYDVVVIGSGYGGAICASLAARARRRDGSKPSVCLLERGREIPVGSFPSTFAAAVPEFRIAAGGLRYGREDGLYRLHAGKGISVFHGCGLGGTSLINAGVSLRPDPRVWQDQRWPEELVADVDAGLARAFERAAATLAPAPYAGPPLLKDIAFRRTARALNADDRVYAPPLDVSFGRAGTSSGSNGGDGAACTGCGECVAGCNAGAKNTLAMNYLPDARRHGAEIFCGVSVRCIESTRPGYRVFYQPVRHARATFDGADLFLSAELVIVAAGVLGSTEILLRSKQAGLPCSDQLGKGLSGNGALLGFDYDGPFRVNAVGTGKASAEGEQVPGPCITSIVDRRASLPHERAHVIENGVIPGALASALPAFVEFTSECDRTTAPSAATRFRALSRAAMSLLRGGRDALDRAQTLLVMSHDDSSGRIVLRGEHLEIEWPNERAALQAFELHDELATASASLRGVYVPALGREHASDHQLTVHPLGGCPMGRDAAVGFTNHKGQVYSRPVGVDVHESLYVIDGSVIPCSLGINPHLTISAIAERNARLLIEDRGWTIEKGTPARSSASGASSDDALRMQFTERIVGYCSTSVLGENQHRAAWRDAKKHRSTCTCVVTVAIDDCLKMAEDPVHAAKILGSVDMPALSCSSMSIVDGRFNLFIDSPDCVSRKHMCYRMTVRSVEGYTYHFNGFKRLGGRGLLGLWDETTRLYLDVYRGVDSSGPKIAQGIAYITAPWFARELLHMRGTDARGAPSLESVVRYGWLFASGLWDIYRPAPSGSRRKQGTS